MRYACTWFSPLDMVGGHLCGELCVADLPVIDILFGSFYNPQGFSDTGFYDGASSRAPEMLLWQDVYKPRVERGTKGLTKTGLTKEVRA